MCALSVHDNCAADGLGNAKTVPNTLVHVYNAYSQSDLPPLRTKTCVYLISFKAIEVLWASLT